MSSTFTPELEPGVLERLHAYAWAFRPLFQRIDQCLHGRTYLHGLLLDGERKSIEPLSQRVPGGNEQALQQFINQSPWAAEPVLAEYRARLAAVFARANGVIVVDDTGFPKQGKHSVGVARQYSGTLGKTGNCQIAVSVHYVTAAADYPLALRLYLPRAWCEAPDRLERARVPAADRAFKPKWQIALELVDTVRAEGLPHQVVVADAGYGAITEFRTALEQRQEAYIVGLAGTESVFAQPPQWEGAPRRTRVHLAADAPRPVAVKTLAADLPRTRVCWRTGEHGAREAEFAWVRVWPAHGWQDGIPSTPPPDPAATARWLLVEWRADGTVKYALSNLPADTVLPDAVGPWKQRWQVEQGYQQLKDELGLDHFEGRSWVGFHHHATMTFLAYGFLALERHRAADCARTSGPAPPPGAAAADPVPTPPPEPAPGEPGRGA
ncbi:MAG: IS701 family transposase [Gammaproteobacteria bacterium]